MIDIIFRGIQIQLLPNFIIYYYESLLAKIFRLLGSICVILCITKLYLIISCLGLLFKCIGYIYLFILIILSIIKVLYGFYYL